MPCFHCGDSNSGTAFSRRRQRQERGWRGLSKAAAGYARARLREAGQLEVAPDWKERLEICRGCPLYTVVDGKAFCGKPLWQQVSRREGSQGCGCPVVDKARDPAEHCPLGAGEGEAGEECACKWCRLRRLHGPEGS